MRGNMSNTISKVNVHKKWQKGVALLFALGILGLLLVMALGFATNSIFDQLIASNNGNSSAARTIAQSGLERVRNILQNYAEKMRDIAAPYNFRTDGFYGYSHSEDASVFNTNTNNSYAKSDKLQDFFSSYLFPASAWSNNMTDYINWIYFSADGRINGRMAYIILNRADLDPARLVRSGVDESYASFVEPQEVRIGADANEINLRTLDPAITQPVALNFNDTADGGLFNGNSWLDMPFLFDQFGLADATMQKKFTRWFICNSQKSAEAYWIDKDGDGKIVSNELLHRFNLARTDWATINTKTRIYNLLLLDALYSGAPNIDIFVNPNAADPINVASGDLWTDETFDGKGIPWLALFGYKTDGTLDATLGATFPGGVVTRRNQIVANLVDYCQPVTVSATSDSPADWLTTPPTYTGNKKTPYINEFGGEVQLHTEIVLNAPKYDIAVNLNFYLYSEIINIYAANWVTPLRLNVKGSFTYDYNIGNLGAVVNQTQAINVDINAFNWSNGYGTDKRLINSITINKNGVPPGQEHATVSNVRFKIDSAVLYVPGASNIFYDYANVDKTATLAMLENNYTTVTVAGTGDDQTSWFSIETEDPRQNLNTTDWIVNTAPAVNNGTNLFYVWTAVDNAGVLCGAVNTNSNPAVRHGLAPATTDAETATDPANGSLSTAYIRELPMVSPWELGFIHRGEKWQTLNLHKYDDTKATKAITVGANKYPPGGGAYDLGDANILDQIKMNNSSKNYKIDLNNEFQDPVLGNRYMVLYSLFKNIKSGSTMDLVNGITGGTAIADPLDINNIVSTGIIGRASTGTNIYKTRAHVVNDIASGPPITNYLTKALKDEILGKMINLVDFDSYFTVILVAQTIRDVGGSGSSIPINKKLPGDATFSTVNAELGKFDLKVVTAPPPDKYYYADEITSTLKVQAVVHKKIDGTCEILSIKYIQ